MLKSSQQFNVNLFVSESNQVKNIPINMLIPYHNHQFELYSGERLEDMIQSIKKNGILNPIIVQPIENGSKYEILSGHNRVQSAKLVGLEYIPAIVKENLSEDEAEMYVIETNLIQRGFSELLISEQASIIEYRYSKMFSQGKRNDIINEINKLENKKSTCYPLDNKLNSGNTLDKKSTCYPVDNKLKSRDILAKEYSLSPASISRLLRINHLIKPLKDMIDNKSISTRVGIELSYISEDGQTMIYNIISDNNKKIDMKLSKTIRNLFNSNEPPAKEALESLIIEEKKKNNIVKVPLNRDVYSQYFDKKTPPNEIADTIQKALDIYFNLLKEK